MMREAFSRAAAKPEGSTSGDFLEAILRERSDLREQTAYFPERGGCAHTVIIGDEVFKGPNDPHMIYKFDKEHEILKKMEGKGLHVPKVTCVGKDAVFFGMTRMPGVVLGTGFESRLTPDEQQMLAKDIANFMVGMAKALPPQNGKFAMHADFHPGNVLVDTETKKLSAVIDFGLVAYCEKDTCMWFDGASHVFNTMLKKEYGLRKNEIPDPAPIKKQPSPERPAT